MSAVKKIAVIGTGYVGLVSALALRRSAIKLFAVISMNQKSEV